MGAKHTLTAWTVVVACLAVAAGIGIHYWSNGHKRNTIANYTPESLHQVAQWLVDGLNTHDPDKVGLVRAGSDNMDSSTEREQLDKQIASAMPSPGCNYTLDGVTDRGPQGDKSFHWGTAPTYRFDMRVIEQCAGRETSARSIGVIAIPGPGAHWEEVDFELD